MTVLVTGADGFLGSTLMNRNSNFVGIDLTCKNKKVDICDLRDKKAFHRYLQDHHVTEIIHLAGVQYNTYIQRKNRLDFFRQNIEFAESIKHESVLLGIRKVVYVSTDMVYGDRIKSPISEELTPNPIGEYGASKLNAEKILLENNDSFNLVILRPRLILGKGRVGTIQKLARLINSPFPIIIIGNGKNRYQFVDIFDVCSAIELSLMSNISGIFNIGSDNPSNLDAIFKFTLEALGKKKYMLKVPMKLSIFIFNILDYMGLSPLAPEQYKIAGLDFFLETSKIKNSLGWIPTKSDETMLFESLSVLMKPNSQD